MLPRNYEDLEKQRFSVWSGFCQDPRAFWVGFCNDARSLDRLPYVQHDVEGGIKDGSPQIAQNAKQAGSTWSGPELETSINL